MALLEMHGRSKQHSARALASVALCLLAACAFLQQFSPSKRRFAFSHERHVTLEKLDCANCHADAMAAEDPGMPARDTCDVCHAEIDKDKPAARHIDTLFAGDVFAAVHVNHLSSEIVFSHKAHASGKQACSDCHHGIEHSADVEQEASVRMDDCTQCHAQHKPAPRSSDGASDGCTLCHHEITQSWAPASHHANWKKAHGPLAREKSEESAARCATCHTEASCSACHQIEAPENHTPYWHQRGHGIVAMADRQNCAACHEPASCERCHAESRPRNHSGPWGAPHDTHCLTCHQPLKYEGCSACHPSTPSHLSAAHQPADHFPGMNCRQCHGLSEPLPHVDNGDDCSSCHRR
jgi:hypothetical protein